jgi:predicted metal-dependent HD superfamily phosphohydrolase
MSKNDLKKIRESLMISRAELARKRHLDMKLRYTPHTLRLKIVDHYIRVFFRDELPDGIKYHDADHTLHPTKGVVASANRIAISENISEHNRELLITAAYFHDTGYIREYKKNEPIAARMAGRILKLIGYKPNEVVKIQKMILSTDLESEPESHVEKILCDADLDHFGRKDFFKLDGRLREEWREKGMDVSDEVKWYKGTLEILKKHQYYTESQKKLREKGKQKNIKSLIKKLENIEKRYEAKYNPVLIFQQPQL